MWGGGFRVKGLMLSQISRRSREFLGFPSPCQRNPKGLGWLSSPLGVSVF